MRASVLHLLGIVTTIFFVFLIISNFGMVGVTDIQTHGVNLLPRLVTQQFCRSTILLDAYLLEYTWREYHRNRTKPIWCYPSPLCICPYSAQNAYSHLPVQCSMETSVWHSRPFVDCPQCSYSSFPFHHCNCSLDVSSVNG